MAYTEKHPSFVPVGAGAADDLSTTGVHSYSLVIQSQIEVVRLMATVTVATVGAATVAFKKRINFGSTTGEITLGSVIIPGSSGLSDTIYKDISPVVMEPGQQLVFEVTSAATSGSAVYGVEANEDPEQAANQSNMIASA